MGVFDIEMYFLVFCNWFRVMFKGFRDCVIGKMFDGLLEVICSNLVVVRLGGVIELIFNMMFVVLFDNIIDVVIVGLVEVVLEEIVIVEDFFGVVSFVFGGLI